MSVTSCHHRYLGLPTAVGRKKADIFAFLRERVWERINSWRGLFFSHAGKETLIQAVLQAIPNYVACCFRLPQGLVDGIHKAIASFWWGDTSQGKKIHWCKWSELTRHKSDGGLGFRDIGVFNQALLAKSVWNIFRRPDSLVGKVLCQSYYPNGDILNATCGSAGSYIWRSLC